MLLAGCTQGPAGGAPEADPGPPVLGDLAAPGADVGQDGANRTLTWTDSLDSGAAVPLLGPAPNSAAVGHTFDVDGSVAVLWARVDGGPAALYLDDAEGRPWCAVKQDQVCGVPVDANRTETWNLQVRSLAPEGVQATTEVTLSPFPPVRGDDAMGRSGYTVHAPGRSGGEPTLAVTPGGSVLVVAGNDVMRLDTDGAWDEVTPPVDQSADVTLDPFLVGDPVTGKVYVSQLAACQRISWTQDGGETWTSNPLACGGPDQHHQKLAVGPAGPTGIAGDRALHMMTMNLASWLTTDEVVITHARSLDDGLTWVQTEAMAEPVHGLEARAIGNVDVADDGGVHAIAYLCDAFNGAPYEGLGLGVSRDSGATWSWQKVAPGGGPCEGIDPGIAVRDDEVHAVWWDAAAGQQRLWHAVSEDAGATWGDPMPVPTGGLRSFVLADLAAVEGRLAAAFLATADTDMGPNQAPGWAHWYPYVAVHDGNWSVMRLEDHPVQIGRLCMEGPTCLGGSRNLLDFLDVQFGPEGRVHVAYADGCLDDCETAWQSRGADVRVAIEP